MPQERRSYSKSFKAQVIAECAQADTSIGGEWWEGACRFAELGLPCWLNSSSGCV